jgi:hypothetical protein
MRRVFLVVLGSLVVGAGCDGPGAKPPPPPPLSFHMGVDYGVFSHDLIFANKSPTLEGVDVEITL